MNKMGTCKKILSTMHISKQRKISPTRTTAQDQQDEEQHTILVPTSSSSLRSLIELACTRGDHLINQTRASMSIDQAQPLVEQVSKVLRILNQNGIIVVGQW